jgi:hypothetical protein
MPWCNCFTDVFTFLWLLLGLLVAVMYLLAWGAVIALFIGDKS